MTMTVAEFAGNCKSTVKVMSAFNGKILCHKYDDQKHQEIGQRVVRSFCADIKCKDDGYGSIARPYICVFADGTPEAAKHFGMEEVPNV